MTDPTRLAETVRVPTFDVGEDEDDFNGVDFQSAQTVREIEELFGAREISYVSANNALQAELKSRVMAGESQSSPAEFMRFIAQNTNPNRRNFSWENLLEAMLNCIRKLSPSPLIQLVLSQNCVHCARAIDQTLQKAFDRTESHHLDYDLIQVDRGNMGNFYEICGMDKLKSIAIDTKNKSEYIEALKNIVKVGEYACISVPVTSADDKFGHAMNIVNAGPEIEGAHNRIFVLCGQSGRIFDLENSSDVAEFCARHTSASAEGVSIIYHTPAKGGLVSPATEQVASIHPVAAMPVASVCV